MIFSRGARLLARARSGAVAVIYALCFMAILIVVGFAVDFSLHRGENIRVQSALDMAGLAAARHLTANPNATDAELVQIAQDYFDVDTGGSNVIAMHTVQLTRNPGTAMLEVSVKGDMETGISHIFGHDTLPLSAGAHIGYGTVAPIEIALVLDTSHSMSAPASGGTRISVLEEAVTEMIDAAVVDGRDDVRMSIVPFQTYVNVGLDKRGEPWLNVQADVSLDMGEICRPTDEWRADNCTIEFVDCDGRDGITLGSNICSRDVCPIWDQDTMPRVCEPLTQDFTWFGCVQSRPSPNDLLDDFYATTPVVGIISQSAGSCAEPIQELSSDKGQLIVAAESLRANGETYIPAGLMWGLRTLSSDAPFAEGSAEPNARKMLVLMSDGENTMGATATGEHEDTVPIAIANGVTDDACNFIKGEGVAVYTIAFDVSDFDTTALLRNCATNTEMFYEADDADEMKSAFEAITNQIPREVALYR